jgi:hypothetical protein
LGAALLRGLWGVGSWCGCGKASLPSRQFLRELQSMAGDGRDGPKDDTEAEGELEVYWEAVREGDKLAIEAMLVGDEEHPPIGIGVDVTDREGLTTLMWLTVEGHATVAQWLIDDVDADVEMTDKRYGQTALHFAAVKGNNMIAELLLHRKCDPARRDFAGWTPLHARAPSMSQQSCWEYSPRTR